MVMKTMAALLALLLPAAQQRRDGDVKVGDPAPALKARSLADKSEVELKQVLEKEKKPVVLIFGSYT